MKKSLVKYLLFVLMCTACATSNTNINKREFRKSKSLVTYSGMANEFQDGYLILLENGYFKFYQKFWLIVSIKQGEYLGRYSQVNDTIHLNWLDTDPKEIKYYLSNKCIIDTGTNYLWFVDEVTNKKLWGLGLR